MSLSLVPEPALKLALGFDLALGPSLGATSWLPTSLPLPTAALLSTRLRLLFNPCSSTHPSPLASRSFCFPFLPRFSVLLLSFTCLSADICRSHLSHALAQLNLWLFDTSQAARTPRAPCLTRGMASIIHRGLWTTQPKAFVSYTARPSVSGGAICTSFGGTR
jgi:hypothetical protein